MKARRLKQIGGRSYRSWKLWEEGDYVIGRVTAFYEDNYDNPGYELEVIECDFYDKSAEVAPGKLIGLNSAGGLNHKMKSVEIGDTVKIEYGGTDTLEKGKFAGKEYHVVNMWVVEEEEENIPDPVGGRL